MRMAVTTHTPKGLGLWIAALANAIAIAAAAGRLYQGAGRHASWSEALVIYAAQLAFLAGLSLSIVDLMVLGRRRVGLFGALLSVAPLPVYLALTWAAK